MWYAKVNEANEVVLPLEDFKDQPVGIRIINGLPILRPVIFDNPGAQPWEHVANHEYEVRNDSVVAHGVLSDRPAEEMRATKLSALEAVLSDKLDEGVMFKGVQIQMRDTPHTDRDNIGNMALMAVVLGEQWTPMQWRARDNSFVEISTAVEMITMAQEIGQAVIVVKANYWHHKDALNALDDAEELWNYDITQGW
jgi:hypothetical protein